jgi:predicted signal transduction protein with EAL and GGDEF domain
MVMRIQACVHSDDTTARLGSDEFAVILENLDFEIDQAAKQAEGVAERILLSIKKPFDLNGSEYYCSACVGISLFRENETEMEELLKQADSAMFQAKKSGRDRIHFFDAGMQATLEEHVKLESWLRKALPEQLRLYFQLQTNSRGQTECAEVLLRWQHPEIGMISPAAFIPLAEETGLILPIGRWVLETACLQLKAWEAQANMRHMKLAVNVSAKQFHQPNFVDQVMDVLNQTGADPTRLKLELTESLLVENLETVIANMTALKAEGIVFSLDDFGTGFSSLSYLKRLPLSQLKIDQSFVRDLLEDPNDAAIVRTVIALGQSLGLEVIAEGVETEEQKNFLAAHGCNHYQGYLFSKPVPVEDFERILARNSSTHSCMA